MNFHKLTRAKVIAILALVLGLVTATTLIWYGHHGNEPTLVYTERVWPETPVMVASGSLPGAARAVVSDVNRQLGFPMLQYADPEIARPAMMRGAAAIAVIVDPSAGPPMQGHVVDTDEGSGHYWLRRATAETHTCLVSVHDVPSTVHITDVLIHEIGHCLGLAHDDYPGSVMYPLQSEGPRSTRISDMDRAALRNAYGYNAL